MPVSVKMPNGNENLLEFPWEQNYTDKVSGGNGNASGK